MSCFLLKLTPTIEQVNTLCGKRLTGKGSFDIICEVCSESRRRQLDCRAITGSCMMLWYKEQVQENFLLLSS